MSDWKNKECCFISAINHERVGVHGMLSMDAPFIVVCLDDVIYHTLEDGVNKKGWLASSPPLLLAIKSTGHTYFCQSQTFEWFTFFNIFASVIGTPNLSLIPLILGCGENWYPNGINRIVKVTATRWRKQWGPLEIFFIQSFYL